MATKSKVTPVEVTTNPQHAVMSAPVAQSVPFSFTLSGTSIARNESQSSRLIAELGEHLAAECREFAAWEAARLAFIEGAQSVGYAAPQDLWERVVKRGQEWGVVPDKPKSAAPAAQAKAKARAEVKAKAPSELQADIAAAVAKGDLIAAGKAQAALNRATAAADKAARLKAQEKCKPALERIKAAQAACLKASDNMGIELLAKCADLIAAGQHGKLSKAIAALKVPAVKVPAVKVPAVKVPAVKVAEKAAA